MSKHVKNKINQIGFVVLIITLSFSCGRESEPRSGQESLDLLTQDNPASKTQSDNRDGTADNLMKDHAYLELTLHNSTGGMIDETAVFFGKHSSTFGIVGKEGSKGYLGWTHPVGTNALIRWRDSQKIKKEIQVDISAIYDRATPGNLTFTIVGTNVAVRFEKLDRK